MLSYVLIVYQQKIVKESFMVFLFKCVYVLWIWTHKMKLYTSVGFNLTNWGTIYTRWWITL